MASVGKEKWLNEGYRQFAKHGPEKMSVNQISKDVFSSRASFYHFFGEVDIFIDELLIKYWHNILLFNQEGKEQCNYLFPDLYKLLGKDVTLLQFSLQLFHHRDFPRFNYLFNKTISTTADGFMLKLFADELGLNPNHSAIYNLWLTVVEAWYSRLDPKDLSWETLQHHGKEVIGSVSCFLHSDLYRTILKIT